MMNNMIAYKFININFNHCFLCGVYDLKTGGKVVCDLLPGVDPS